jgi:uncharacterized protein (DUF1778 family)
MSRRPRRVVRETATAQEARLNFRLDAAIKDLIERAASYSGETVTSYAISTLVRDARRVVQEHEQTTLSERDREVFLSLLDDPPAPNDALRRAAARYRELISGDETP